MATNNPLTIFVDAQWNEHLSVQALREAGHDIKLLADDRGDLILSTKAWNWSDSMWPYLDIALKAARKDKPKGKNVNAKVSSKKEARRKGTLPTVLQQATLEESSLPRKRGRRSKAALAKESLQSNTGTI